MRRTLVFSDVIKIIFKYSRSRIRTSFSRAKKNLSIFPLPSRVSRVPSKTRRLTFHGFKPTRKLPKLLLHWTSIMETNLIQQIILKN